VKVYCGECRYLKLGYLFRFNPFVQTHCEFECWSPENKVKEKTKGDWIWSPREYVTKSMKPQEKNKNNDCNWFVAKRRKKR
jgi:hypothetical protein